MFSNFVATQQQTLHNPYHHCICSVDMASNNWQQRATKFSKIGLANKFRHSLSVYRFIGLKLLNIASNAPILTGGLK
jgi:hypothetical protein